MSRKELIILTYTLNAKKYMLKKAIVLLSGGIDSATTLFLARKKRYRCTCLIFEYGQRHKKEIECAKKLAKLTNSKYALVKINLPSAKSSLLDKKKRIPTHIDIRRISKGIPSTYVPGRNIVFLSFALSFAENLGADTVFIGAHIQDYSGYPDCRPEFLDAFARAGRLGTKTQRIKIEAPLVYKEKKDIIKLATKLWVPFGFTWSCYKGGKRPCGKCDSCLYRRKGFEEAGLEDPLL